MVEAMPQQEEATSLPPQADTQKQKEQTQQTQRDMEEEKRLSSGTESGTDSEDSEDDDDDVVGPARPPLPHYCSHTTDCISIWSYIHANRVDHRARFL